MGIFRDILTRTDHQTYDPAKVAGALGFMFIFGCQSYSLYIGQPFNVYDLCNGLGIWGATVAGWVRIGSRTRKGILTGKGKENGEYDLNR